MTFLEFLLGALRTVTWPALILIFAWFLWGNREAVIDTLGNISTSVKKIKIKDAEIEFQTFEGLPTATPKIVDADKTLEKSITLPLHGTIPFALVGHDLQSFIRIYNSSDHIGEPTFEIRDVKGTRLGTFSGIEINPHTGMQFDLQSLLQGVGEPESKTVVSIQIWAPFEGLIQHVQFDPLKGEFTLLENYHSP